MQNSTKFTRKHSLSNQLSWAILGALAFIVMLFEFPIIPALLYLKMDLSDVIVTISTFLFGPVGGILIGLIKATLNFFIKGANLMNLVGDIAAFFASVSFALPIYYLLREKKQQTFKISKMIIAFIVATLSLTVILSILNYFLITPMYITLAGFKLNMSLLNYILYAVVPFNLFKGIILSIVTGLLLKTVLPTLEKYTTKRQ